MANHWIKCSVKLPKKEGRFLVLVDFEYPCISNSSIVRKNVPLVSNYTPERGWNIGQDVTYWMEIPPLLET